MVSIALAAFAIVLSTGALLYAWRVLVVLSVRIKLLELLSEDVPDAVWKRDLEHMLRLMDERITEESRHGKRREERARGVVRGALKRLDEAGVRDPSVEAEAEELGIGDGEDGIPEFMSPMPDAVEGSPVFYEDSPIPGLSVEEYKALLGGSDN